VAVLCKKNTQTMVMLLDKTCIAGMDKNDPKEGIDPMHPT
jgi:hypothetical protein